MSRIKEFIGLQDPLVCFQCRRCTSGCPVAFLEKDYRPHRIVAYVIMDRVDQLLENDVVWKCTRCYKCTEYCPQAVAPSDVVMALQELVSEKKGLPEAYVKMIKTVASTGLSFEEMDVADREFEIHNRESLGLAKLQPPSRIGVISKIVKALGGVE